MPTVAQQPFVFRHLGKKAQQGQLPPLVADYGLEDASPYGLQGLSRDSIQVIKEDCVTRLAIALALRGNRQQIRDPEFVERIFQRHPEWRDEYHVVNLIEQSLWIDGHCDLVMTLTRNPSQIPDDPPPIVKRTLSEAYATHPQATIWYGVPLFGDEQTPEGLPIPLTAQEVQKESERRLQVAQAHALRWGWAYRLMAAGVKLPAAVWQECLRTGVSLRSRAAKVTNVCSRIRRNAQRKNRAECRARLEYCRTGTYRPTVTHSDLPMLDRVVLQGTGVAQESALRAGQFLAVTTPAAAGGWAAFMFHMSLFAPAAIVSCDPFLFIELPEEPGKLRHLAHWYWQEHNNGKRTLHLHA